jgi:hypothetical protein
VSRVAAPGAIGCARGSLGRRRPVPEDLGGYAERLGYAEPGALLRALRIERWFATRR